MYLHRHHAQRLPAGCGYQRRALLCTAYLWRHGNGEPDGHHRLHGCHQPPLHAGSHLHGGEMGAKTPAHQRFAGYGAGCLRRCRHLRSRRSGARHRCLTARLCGFVHVLMGPHLLGIDSRDIPQHHSWCCCCHRRCLPVDFQLHRLVNVRAHVQHAPDGGRRLRTLVHLRTLRHHLSCRCCLCMATGSRDEGQDAGGYDQAMALEDLCAW